MVKMCPKRKIISLHCDGEIPSPWKEKMEAHLESCPECRAVLTEYGYLGKYLQGASEDVVSVAKERVWKKLTAPELIIPAPEPMHIKPKSRPWNTHITLPLPVAAAAAFVIVASFVFVGISALNRTPPPPQVISAGMNLDDQGIVPISDMASVIQYISNQGLGDYMVIRLPESQSFSRSGEPVLINAADYSRRNVFR